MLYNQEQTCAKNNRRLVSVCACVRGRIWCVFAYIYILVLACTSQLLTSENQLNC